MIKFKYLKFKNFLSFGNKETFFDLDTEKSRLIVGNNEDIGDQGSSRNGCGKSSTFNALLFGLFGKGIDKLKTDEFINVKNGKNLEVEVCFEKGSDTIIVRRKRKPNAVEILINGESLTLDAMKNTDELVVKTLGMSYENFMATFFMAPHKHSFMAMSGPEQRSLIEEMLSLHVLQERAESLKIIRKELEVDAKIIERDIENAEENNRKTNQLIESLTKKSEDFDKDVSASIARLESLVSELNSVDVEDVTNKFSTLELSKKELTTLSEKMNTRSASVQSMRAERVALSHAMDDVKRNLETRASIENDLSAFEDLKRDQLEKASSRLGEFKSIDFYEEVIEAFGERDTLSTEIKELLRDSRDCDSELTRVVSDIQKKEAEIASFKNEKCPLCGSEEGDTTKAKNDAIKELDGLNVKAVELEDIRAQIRDEIARKESQVTAISEKYMCEDPQGEIRQLEKILDEIERIESSNSDHIREKLMILDDAEAYIEEHDRLSVELELLDKSIASENDNIDTMKGEVSALKSTTEELARELNAIGFNHPDDITKHLVNIQRNIDALDNLKNGDSGKNPFEEEIVKAVENLYDISELQESRKEKEKEVKHATYLIKLLTDNKSFIRKNIVDKYVPYLNKKLVEYTQQLGLPHLCEINADMSVDIQYMGSSVSYYNLSQGERLRLNISTTFAFRDLMLMLGKNTNIMLIDEMLDSALDDSGRSAVMRFITAKVPNLLIISHREEVGSMVDETVTITKRNGFSFIS